MIKSLFIVYLFIMLLAFPGCASARQPNNLNKLSDEEIDAYNNDPTTRRYVTTSQKDTYD